MDEQTPVGVENKPTKKLFALFGAIFAVALIAGVSAYYLWLRGPGAGAPPSLQVDISTLSQGKLKPIKGFAQFDKDAPADFCSGKTSVALTSRVMHLFSTKKITFKEVVAALKPVKDMQYLIAFYSPGEEAGVEPTAFANDTNTYYVYPTATSPFKTEGAGFTVKAVAAGEGVKIVIPAYRGFQIIVDDEKNAALCGDNFNTGVNTDSIWSFSNDKAAQLANEKIIVDMKILPAGWVMIPAGYDLQLTAMFYAMIGQQDVVDAIYYQKGANDFSSSVDLSKFNTAIKNNNLSSVSDIGIKDGLTWFYLKESVNVKDKYDEFMKSQGGESPAGGGGNETGCIYNGTDYKVGDKVTPNPDDPSFKCKIGSCGSDGNVTWSADTSGNDPSCATPAENGIMSIKYDVGFKTLAITFNNDFKEGLFGNSPSFTKYFSIDPLKPQNQTFTISGHTDNTVTVLAGFSMDPDQYTLTVTDALFDQYGKPIPENKRTFKFELGANGADITPPTIISSLVDKNDPTYKTVNFTFSEAVKIPAGTDWKSSVSVYDITNGEGADKEIKQAVDNATLNVKVVTVLLQDSMVSGHTYKFYLLGVTDLAGNSLQMNYPTISFSANELALESIAVDMTTKSITFVFKDEVKVVEGFVPVVYVKRVSNNNGYSSEEATLDTDGKTVSAVFSNLTPDDYIVTNFDEIVSAKDGTTSYHYYIAEGSKTFKVADAPIVTALNFSPLNKVKVTFDRPVKVFGDEKIVFDFKKDGEEAALILVSAKSSTDGSSVDVEFADNLPQGRYVLKAVSGVVGDEDGGNLVNMFLSMAKEFDVKTLPWPITFNGVVVSVVSQQIFTISFGAEMAPVVKKDVTVAEAKDISEIPIEAINLNSDGISFTVITSSGSVPHLECGKTYTIKLSDNFKGTDGRPIDLSSLEFTVPTTYSYCSLP